MKTFYLLTLLFHLIINSCISASDKPFTNPLSEKQQTAIQNSWKNEGLIDTYLNGFIGNSIDTLNEFYLSKNDPSISGDAASYGNHIRFTLENKFSSNYSAPCGNDCFPFAHGTYEFVDDDKIRLYLINYGQMGMCKELDIKINKVLGTFTITKEPNDMFKFIKN